MKAIIKGALIGVLIGLVGIGLFGFTVVVSEVYPVSFGNAAFGSTVNIEAWLRNVLTEFIVSFALVLSGLLLLIVAIRKK